MPVIAGVDLLEIFWATQISGGEELAITDEIVGVSQLLGRVGDVPGLPLKSTLIQ